MTNINTIAELAQRISPAAPAAGASAAVKDTQDRFLTLLVTQMKNQDPLNPMDNAQVTTQMAQLSMVNGIDKLNANLSGVAQSLAAAQTLQAGSLVGRDVLVPGAVLRLEAGSAHFGMELAQPVDRLTVTVLDAAGNAVNTVDLGAQPAGMQVFEWDGGTNTGTAAPSGVYTFTLDARAAGKPATATALSLGRIDGVANTADGVRLKLNGIGAFALGDVKQIM